MFLTAGILVLGLAAVAGLLVVNRYLPALDEARTLKTDLVALSSRAQDAGLEIDRPTLDGLTRDLATARERFARLQDMLQHDPLVGVARSLSPTAGDVQGADVVVAAAGDLFEAADQGLAIGRRFVEIKEAQAADPGTASALSQLVELMATSRERALAVKAALDRARDRLASVPDAAPGPIEDARAAIADRVDRYGPILDTYLSLSDRIPSILGWDAPRRYLVLTQNPAELRPTGGYTGSYGVIAFDKGRVTERTFRDIYLLDTPWQRYPFVTPPEELANYLVGEQSWQLADANWSPDFPTSAKDAIRLYANESGDSRIDGVLGVTTYTIDELLKTTGPITVPEYSATIASGETTLKTLQLTRVPRPGENRKAFLSSFADRLLASLLGLPPRKWVDVLGQVDTFRSQRLLLAWFKDGADQALASRGGFDGAVRQDPGDYVYPVDANLAPSSKINAIATRSLHLDVAIDPLGNAVNTLDVTWTNPIDTPIGKPYLAIGPERILGMYFRLLAPERSRVESVSGGKLVQITAPADVTEEAGRTVIGNYLMVPPGSASLRYVWTSPYAADADTTGGIYRVTIQKQPGLLPGPLTVTIHVPAGFRIATASQDLQVSGGTATMTTTFTQDLVLGLRYAATGTSP